MPFDRARAPSSWLAGDPDAAPAGIASRAGLLEWLHLPPGSGEAAAIAPGIAFVFAGVGAPAGLTLRWVRLPHAPALAGGAACEAAIVGVGPWARAGEALALAGRFAASLADPGARDAALAARTREALVQALAPREALAGERALPAAQALALLGTSPDGLDEAEAARRLEQAGANRLEHVRRRPLALRLLEQLWSFFAVLLWVGGALAILAGMPRLGWAIFAVIVINAAFSFVQEYRAERALASLERLLPPRITVRRAGAERVAPALGLVPGDVVRLEEGDQVPADAFVLSADGLRVDQAPLTGESHPSAKRPPAPGEAARDRLEDRPDRVYAGTGVVAGSGLAVVIATGMATEIGGIARLTQSVAGRVSPLQREMAQVTRAITVLAVGIGVGCFVLASAFAAMPLREGFLFALGVIVANVPEGLLPTLTLALAIGVQRMARRRALVRRPSAVEALGAVSVIGTDKTGTLTENRMTARAAWTPADGCVGPPWPERVPADLRALLECAALASVATRAHGDPTERALVEAAWDAGVNVDAARAEHAVGLALPFDAFRKRMTLVRAHGRRRVAHAKGAPLPLLERCTRVRDGTLDRPLSARDREQVTVIHDRLATDGLRLLAVAERALDPAHAGGDDADAIECDLTLLGLVALWDPPRAEVPEAVAQCRRAGIHVVVITGDEGLTARAIARQVGLEAETLVSGDEVDRLSPEALADLALEGGVVFARTSPAHKLAIVQALRGRGHVVAATGDGVNDAPALRAADVGIAMGRRGSEVARASADVVLADDHFASIVAAIRLGRATYDNIGRFIAYDLASNVGELVPFLALVFLRVPLPLNIMQVLAVDLGTDLVPALGLGAEPPEPDVMERPPRDPRARLLDGPRLLHAYAFLGVAEAALAMAAWAWTWHLGGWSPGRPFPDDPSLARRASTMTFAGIVAAQVGNVFACRTSRQSVFRAGLLSNRYVLAGIAVELALAAAIILLPPLQAVFGTEPPRFEEWRILFAFPFAMLAVEELRKAWLRSRARA